MSACATSLHFKHAWRCAAGIGNVRDGLHPVQERLANAHGSQCGFCTPGFVMSMYSLLRCKTQAPSEQEIEEALAGNLWCACARSSICSLMLPETAGTPHITAWRSWQLLHDPNRFTRACLAAA